MKTAIVMDWRYTDHNMGAFHMESPARIEAIYKMIEEQISFPFLKTEPRAASQEEILWVHTPSYFDAVKETKGRERVVLDPDMLTSPKSFETALLAAGGLLKAADLIMDGKAQNGFALVRPPGHHAEANRAMGFCLFNNVAVAAEYMRNKFSLKRVLIVDWDLHHGNGTQHSFYKRNDILYFSTHQFPHYPGTGHWSETGAIEGEGFTVNVPLSPGKTNGDYLCIFKNILAPIASAFQPEFVLVSAGFDIAASDPLGGMEITADGFGALAAELLKIAEKSSVGRILFALEGGYNLQALQDGVKEVLSQLAGHAAAPAEYRSLSPGTERELSPVFEIQKRYWDL